jgi:mannose-6-phosphate isomerase-like protein (cupin superfamily)
MTKEETMKLIEAPSLINAAGTPAKSIAEYVGRRNTGGSAISIAHMISPRGWQEPGQTPEFDEYTVVLRGVLCVETRTVGMEIRAGEAVVAPKGEWVKYSTPLDSGAEYVAVCLPAFSPETVHRDEVRSDRPLSPQMDNH